MIPDWRLLAAGGMLLLCLWVMFVIIKDNARAIERGRNAAGKLVSGAVLLAFILGLFVVGLFLLIVLIKFLWRLAP